MVNDAVPRCFPNEWLDFVSDRPIPDAFDDIVDASRCLFSPCFLRMVGILDAQLDISG